MLDIVIVTPERITICQGQGQLHLFATTALVKEGTTDFKYQLRWVTPDTSPILTITEGPLEECAAALRYMAWKIKKHDSNPAAGGMGYISNFIYIDLDDMDSGG